MHKPWVEEWGEPFDQFLGKLGQGLDRSVHRAHVFLVGCLPVRWVRASHVELLLRERLFARVEQWVVAGLDPNLSGLRADTRGGTNISMLGVAIETLQVELAQALLAAGARVNEPITGFYAPTRRVEDMAFTPPRRCWQLVPASPLAILLDIRENAYDTFTDSTFNRMYDKTQGASPRALAMLDLLLVHGADATLKDAHRLFSPVELLQNQPLSNHLAARLDHQSLSQTPPATAILPSRRL